MRLLLVAYPGAGKGTQAAKLSEHYGIEHLSSGALLRDEVARRTKTGLAAAAYLERGDLVPDELVVDMLAAPVLKAAQSGGYILDGYPRTVRQAEEAYALAQRLDGIELQAVVYLQVSNVELRRRLQARADRERRSDDTEVVVAHRIEVFDAQTRPLLDFYARRGILLEIDGERTVLEVFADITAAVDRLEGLRIEGAVHRLPR
jgi:adenylate kinase